MRFHHYAWGLLGYTVAVVLGGAFVRATISGDGCGNHWPDCNGRWIPPPGRLETTIEFAHRLSSALLLPLAIALLVWAFRRFPRRHPARFAASLALVLTLVEALIGAALVLFRLVAHDASPSRAVVMPAHLIATFLLLMALTLAAWWGSGAGRPRLAGQGAITWGLGLGLLGTLILGVSGAITALGDTLFPPGSLSEGLHQDFSSTHFLLGLRIYHPLIALSAGLYVTLMAGLAANLRPSLEVHRFARLTVAVFVLQLAVGLVNFLLRAPVWLQLVHLLIADLFWISLVLLAASALAEGVPHLELAPAAAGPRAVPTRAATWRDYLALTKPRVISLLLLTTLAAMFIASGHSESAPGAGLYLAVALGLFMTAGAANAINMVLERDLDLRMDRTARRPTVTEVIPSRPALQFGLGLGVGGFALLWLGANPLAAMLALAGLAFYVVVYTVLLKRRTVWNIVIGGAAGAFPPLVGWAAVTGRLSPLAWCLFAIVFLWTPVHFWALAIVLKDDYARAGVPMLPVLRGVRATVVQIAAYSVLTAAISALPVLLQGEHGRSAVGWFYLGVAALLNAMLLLRSLDLFRHPDRPRARSLFRYSMVYLAFLFVAMAMDRAFWA